MDVEEEPSTSADGDIQAPLEPVGAPSLFFVTGFAPHIIFTLVTSLQNLTDITDMVRFVNDTSRCLVSFNVDLRAMYDQLRNFFAF